jgi:hypothetical protein
MGGVEKTNSRTTLLVNCFCSLQPGIQLEELDMVSDTGKQGYSISDLLPGLKNILHGKVRYDAVLVTIPHVIQLQYRYYEMIRQDFTDSGIEIIPIHE